ncbi:acyl-CoA dehydrogenase family protein [Bacillus cihuensis]|uniref:acyl-CoA dehydrogenase family protein n=1 Tax=Bacillus cihuensis TaxID=1208599 RepID=UPI00041073DE|nr:acyl-CoA dehydrogenase family protein [Bacillus cihuensis]
MTVVIDQVKNYVEIAAGLAAEFAVDIKERDKKGGVPKAQKDALRKSGLLQLLIPKEYGGHGESWVTVSQVIRELAKVDGSVAHIFGYHTFFVADFFLIASEEQRAYYLKKTVEENLFWGNASNPLDRSLFATDEGDQLILNGKKSFSSGSPDSDYLLISWEEKGNPTLFIGAIPTNRAGVTVLDDWDGIGQRQTGSGTVTFENVMVEKSEVFPEGYSDNGSGTSAFSTLGATISQTVLLNVFVGIAQGALEEARQYTLTQSKPWYTSGYQKAIEDPSIQNKYGHYWINLQSAIGLADRAAEKFSQAWEKGLSLSAEERGETAVLVAAANVLAGEVALEITNGIFEVMGARSATRKNGFDRYWRDVRTHTLHNPAEYKRHTVGKWFLKGEYPAPGAYA